MEVEKILILGGYGNFGKRIADGLSSENGLEIIIAGRTLRKAEQMAQELSKNGSLAKIHPAQVNINSPDFQDSVRSLAPDLIIHTAGPFQGQDYKVPLACIELGCHYIDLADDRRYVCDIKILDEKARQKNVLIISGASSVPGLSSTVIDFYLEEFSKLDMIDFCIAPGNKAEVGQATVKGILSYTGHPFKVYFNDEWKNEFGWLSPRRLDFGGPIGKRWLANVDIPDLELFPERYQPIQTVKFQAGLELPYLHITMVFMALLVKMGLLRNWVKYIKPVFILSKLFNNFGTDIGGMQIRLQGLGRDNQKKVIKWTLIAENGIGPYIPTLSAIIIARKLLANQLSDSGAKPCLGMYTLDEFNQVASGLGIYHNTEISIG